jgi:hypothetical protein
MRSSPLARTLFLASFGSALSFATAATAHISLDQGTTHKSRYGDAYLKDGPCGKAGGERSTNVYTYTPGETISVNIVEFIPHPSYFRIAFDEDGDDDFKEPASIEPIDPMRPCPIPGNAADKCGAPDYYNDPSVLPMMDDLDPHVTAAFGQKYTWDVELPNVQCDNCTLQILQVMEDTVHGAYNPTPGDPADTPYVADIYHQCIDLVLEGELMGGTKKPTKAAAAPAKSSGCNVARGTEPSRAPFAVGALAIAALVFRRARVRRS